MKEIVKSCILVFAMGFFLAPFNASAHEGFMEEVGFEKWERHCHEYIVRDIDECWAIYQKRIEKSGSHVSGFVIIVHERQDLSSFELRNVNLFGHTIEVIVDDNKPLRLACHVRICTAFDREDLNQLIHQMREGETILIRNSSKLNKTAANEEIVPLTGYLEALRR